MCPSMPYDPVRRSGKLRSSFAILGAVDFMMYSSIADLCPLRSGVAEVRKPVQYEDLNVNLLTGLDVKPLGLLPWEVDSKKIRLPFKAIFGRKASFKYILELQLGSASMRLLARYKGKEAGTAEMPYEPNAEERPEAEAQMSGLRRKYIGTPPSGNLHS